MERILELLRHEGGLLVRRDHPRATRQLDHCVKSGRLRAVLPGIYAAPDPTWELRIRAAAAFRPGSVVVGAAAARLLWWPECPIDAVRVATTEQVRGSYPGFVWERRRLPPDLIVDRDRVRLACPALSVVELIPTLGGRVIDEALRRKVVRLPELWAALAACPNRSGNGIRRTLLHDSRDEPWSEAERDAHRVLRAAGIVGWRANHRVTIKGSTYFIDIGFPEQGVGIEIDGWEHHGDRAAFTRDRWCLARLGAAGWRMLPFSATAIADEPGEFVELVRLALGRGR